MSSCQTELVTNWKCQNRIRTLTLPTQSQDMSPIENLWCKISENNLGDSYETSDNQTQVDRVAHRSLEPGSHPRPPRQAVHSMQTQCSKAIISKGWPKIY